MSFGRLRILWGDLWRILYLILSHCFGVFRYGLILIY
jgi:hypothetical protein